MSYDIAAFDPAATTDSDFLRWYELQCEETEDHDYRDVAVTTPELRAFFLALSEVFPPLDDIDDATYEQLAADPNFQGGLTSHTIGATMIYACFSWAVADRAREVFCDLAAEHKVAVALVSDSMAPPIIRPQ
ncbi:hypothetical protein [Prescottella agglutinans]|uniref:Uncharacterized protein n=1 Tax=Prescottella agglutinans TaxID=1644129 RepID=A0ABT6MJX7_9NOCA|nr:hypothetical protein [Prescottella agglutinans]MDH6284626.1 hypothetical protein [Prescottella agglutinans]